MIYLPVRILQSLLIIAKVMNEEQRITVCKTSLSQIYTMLRTSPQSWSSYLTLARTIIAHLDSTTLMRQTNRIQEQIWVVAGLQKSACLYQCR